ncbi:MAG: SMK killer toxin resistance protein [Lichina confinis]|nr:MAG: SMK killer toxin resistance protein [Lichina confinis]
MASFLTELGNSIFTPGPNQTLVVATNASFASLQVVLAILLLVTHSVHFVVLSVLCAGLWWAINWFARELEMAKETNKASDGSGELPIEPQGDRALTEEEDTETERDAPSASWSSDRPEAARRARTPPDMLRQRRSVRDTAGEVSTEDEWEKVSEGGSRDQ